jgi:hypothetical protein
MRFWSKHCHRRKKPYHLSRKCRYLRVVIPTGPSASKRFLQLASRTGGTCSAAASGLGKLIFILIWRALGHDDSVVTACFGGGQIIPQPRGRKRKWTVCSLILTSDAKMSGTMKALLVMLLCLLCGCSDSNKNNAVANQPTPAPTKQQDTSQRFLPAGGDPEIALDTKLGVLCRTITDPGKPNNLYDAGCEVKEEYKKLGFIPDSCRSGKTWTKSDLGTTFTTKYGTLPLCVGIDEHFGEITHKYNSTTGKIDPVKP